MNSIQIISIPNLLIGFIPALFVIGVLYKWSLGFGNTVYAVIRMLVQLLLIGYVLTYIFQTENALIVLLVLMVMMVASSVIALRTVKKDRKRLITRALLSIFIGGGITLALVTRGVLTLDPWFYPRYMIPLAGMIFAGSMNSVSLAAERLKAELDRGEEYVNARKTALGAALIPITNSLFAVGLVSLPGMMTGQILSGISPLIAARYQMMVMAMIFGASGVSATLFLLISRKIMERSA